MSKRIWLAVLLAALAACTQGSQESEKPEAAKEPQAQADLSPAYGDTFVDASIGDASTLIPILATDSASHSVAGLIYNGLVKYDGEYNVVGDLAESWEVSDDNLTITFHLKKGVRFHDGAPLTARDVEFTYRVTMDPNTLTAYRGDFEPVDSVEVLDDHTLRVRYKEPFAPALISWGAAVLPRHLLEGKDINTSELGRHPVGTGPFRFVEWTTGQRIVLERNPDYFDLDPDTGMRLPYFDRYVFRIIPDLGVQFNELLAGKIDMMGLKPLQWVRQTESERFRSQYNKYKYLANAYTYLGYNLEKPMFQDVRVRRALTHAIDKNEIVEGVLLGLGVPATGPYKPGTWVYNPDVPKYPYDPEKAKALLAEAGWTDTDGDGVLDKDGQPFRFTVLTNQGNDQRLKSAEIIQQRLKAVGVEIEIRVLEWAAFINEFVKPGKFDAVILGWTITQDPDLYDVWHSSKAVPGGLNHTHYRNPEVDDLLVRARKTFDREERKRLYDRFQEILAEDQPYTFLYVPYALVAVSNRVHGIRPAPAGITYNFERWYVPKALQRHTETP
ncbi:MAG: peptide-binding protein [Candidatus Dadabacteria bacterium]|nr:MAG: peptide-binding protein [Candidatus Dadabacteria bacterium]